MYGVSLSVLTMLQGGGVQNFGGNAYVILELSYMHNAYNLKLMTHAYLNNSCLIVLTIVLCTSENYQLMLLYIFHVNGIVSKGS